MLGVVVAAAIAASACAHVPFFDESTVQLDPQTSQAYYFKQFAGRYAGSVAASPGRRPAHSLVEVVVRESSPCIIKVHCNEHTHHVRTSAGCKRTCEPFTQSSYCVVFRRANMSCSRHFSAVGNCTVPWSIVLGSKETFTAVELASFSLYASRIHGAWWSEAYVAGVVDIVLLVVLSLAFAWTTFWRPGRFNVADMLCATSVATSLAWLTAKFYHAYYTCDGHFVAVLIALAEVPFMAAGACLYTYYSAINGQQWIPGAAVAAGAAGSVFLLGVGHLVGNAMLLLASLAYLSPKQKKA